MPQTSNGVVVKDITTSDIKESNGLPPPMEEIVKAPTSKANEAEDEAQAAQKSVDNEKVEMKTIPLYNYQGNPRLQVNTLFNASID